MRLIHNWPEGLFILLFMVPLGVGLGTLSVVWFVLSACGLLLWLVVICVSGWRHDRTRHSRS
jgi:hypothetical protein